MSFVIAVDSFALNNTRAPHNDTDYICVGFSINGAKSSPLLKALGDVNNGFYKLDGLEFPFPPTYNSADRFVFSYFLLNHGGSSTQDVLGRCQDAMTQSTILDFVDADAQPQASGLPNCLSSRLRAKDNLQFYWDQIKSYFHDGNNLCDGPVAIDRVSFLGSSVTEIILASQQTPISIIFEGMDSRNTCGSDSKYSVQWNVKEVVTQSAQSKIDSKRLSEIPLYAFRLHGQT